MPLRGALVRTNQTPVPYVPRAASKYSIFARPRRQDETSLASYEAVGTIFGIVHSLAVAVAAVDWHLYKPAKSGLKEDRTEVTSHACLDLWRMPNPFMPRRHFVEAAQQHLDLTGESDILTTLVNLGMGKRPIELWPMRPDRITPVPDPIDFLKGWIYTSSEGEEIPLDLTECLPIMMPDPRNPYRGLGPVQSILGTAEAARANEDYDRAFYENSAEPGGVIEVPVTLSDPQFDQLRARWDVQHRGVSKAHRIAILENGMKWVPNSSTARDMQHAEMRTVRRDTILEAFGFPKPMLGITQDVNRANAEAAKYVFDANLVVERLDRWKDWLNYKVLPLYGTTGKNLEWDYDSPVQDNSEAQNSAIQVRAAALVAMAGAGFDAPETQKWLDVPEIGYEKPAPPPMLVPNDPNADGSAADDGSSKGSGDVKPSKQPAKDTPPNAKPDGGASD